MAQSIWNLDFSRTVRDFDFTRKAMQGISRVVTSEDFEDMDVDVIFDYLLNEMEIVVFRDYLRRYIYERAGLTEPFSRVYRSAEDSLLATSLLSLVSRR